MSGAAKEMVAVRLDPADRRKVRAYAERLGVNESELIRYAIKSVLAELGPLSDQGLEGAELLPAFLGRGANMARWLDLDEERLNAILNGDLEDEGLRVSGEDVRTVLNGQQSEGYIEWWSAVLKGEKQLPGRILTPDVYLDVKYVMPLRYQKIADERGKDV